MLEDDALLPGGCRVDTHDRRLVAVDVGGGEQELVVEVEEQRLDLFLKLVVTTVVKGAFSSGRCRMLALTPS